MKKNACLFVFVSSVFALSGCQLTGSGGNNTSIANADFQGMSCDEIKKTFDAYRDQMSNIETGGSLLSAVGAGAATGQGLQLMRTAYSQARDIANPIITAKECNYKL